MTPPINNDINSLSPEFRKRFDPWWSEVTKKYPNAVVFETKRSQERQNRLYAQGRTRPWKIVTRTKTSNHKDWNAVDIVFRNAWKLERAWPYNDLIEIANKYWIRNLKPTETCHFELDTSVKYPTEAKTSVPAINSTNTPSVWDSFKNLAVDDLKLLQNLVADKIRDWQIWYLDVRTLVIISRVYWKSKNNS